MTASLRLRVVLCLSFVWAPLCAPAQTPPAPSPSAASAPRRPPPPIQPKPEELEQVRVKTTAIENAVGALKSRHTDPDLAGDVEVYAKAGKILLEFPDQFFTQNGIDHALGVLDTGIERAKQLQSGNAPWTTAPKQIHAYYSTMDGSIQPYGITLPASYDPSKPARLYVWLHGRQNQTTESEFLYAFPNAPPAKVPVADNGQIQVDVFGRINSAGWHWAGEDDIFETIAAVEKRFKIDPKRILLRGFSMGGEGAWHIALHYPDRFAAAEIGAGTISLRSQLPGLQPYQYATLHIWENMPEWALNVFNLPIAGHDGDHDNQICCLPPPAPQPNRGQLESSLHTRAQLEKEGFPSVGDPDFLHSQGAPGLFLISQDTGHGTSPLVRNRLDDFLKEWGDKGQTSPDHIRFVTWTTRYNHDYWISIDGLQNTYQRADIDALRSEAGTQYVITTKNMTRVTIRETTAAKTIKVDGQEIAVHPAPEITIEKHDSSWKVARGSAWPGLHKTHALQGPIDDAFLEPFLLVRPTGTPWNAPVNDQALRSLARFDRLWARFFRGHAFIKDDKDVTPSDIGNYHLVLFGDPGSNRLIARLKNKLPIRWTKEAVSIGNQTFPAAQNFPALIYPNPLNPAKYVVLNTGLTITDREYNGDYGMPQWGDYAIVTVTPGAEVPTLKIAGLFDESWQLRY